MRSRYTIHAIVKYKIDLHSTNTQINKQYLQRIEYLYFISKIIIFRRAKDFVARKRFSIEYYYFYENHQTMWSIREFKKLRREVQRKRHIKIELCVGFSVLRLFQVVHDEQNRRNTLPFAWHEWWMNEWMRVRVVVRTLKMKISRHRVADCVKNLHQKACRTCSTNFSSFNHFVEVSWSLPTSYLRHGL